MKNYVLSLFMLIPHVLLAFKAFEINEEEYQYLDQLALKFDPHRHSGKSSNWHNYTEVYSKYFDFLKDKPLKFLEIGIQTGAGVRLWEAYFKNADLHFIDITFNEVEYFSKRSHYPR